MKEKSVTKEEFFKDCGKFLYTNERNQYSWKDYYENGRISSSSMWKTYILYEKE